MINNLNITETPEKWVLLKVQDNYYKVFGSWAGGYLDGDRWKLNSGIEKVEQDQDYYYFIGFSGSVYMCHKNNYGLVNFYNASILNGLIKQSNNQIIMVNHNEVVDLIKNKFLSYE